MNLTDKEIFYLCKTKEGCIKYLTENRKEYKGFYEWSYLPSKEVPLLLELLEEGIIEHRINSATKVEEWKVK